MNEYHRDKIQKNINSLVRLSEYSVMKQELLRKKVFTQTMFDIIETDESDEDQRLYMLYKKLPHRGPYAFTLFLDILRENNYEDAYKLMNMNSQNPAQTYEINQAITEDNQFLSIKETVQLLRQNSNSSVSPNSKTSNGNSELNAINNNILMNEEPDGTSPSKLLKKVKPQLQPYLEKTSFNIENLEVKRAENFGSHPKLPVYQMKSKKRGVFFFVNIIKFRDEKTNRRGAERDRENLVTLFSEMNFTIFYYENLTKADALNLLDELRTSDYLKQIDSFFLCIQTHGDFYQNQTIMEFCDGEREYTENIISMFSNVSCPILVGKPKVFLFPFCRGKISDRLKNIPETKNIETDGRANNVMSSRKVPTFSDQLICYGTVPGFMTHRDINFGSWYVRELCRVFAQHSCDTHIEDMLKLVGSNTMMYQEIEGRTQVSSTENRGFNSLLYLNPKIYEY